VLVKAVENDPYNAGDGDISCTTLISPPMIRHLRDANSNRISEDVADRMYSLMGQAMHHVLEMADDDALVEERFYAVYESPQGDKKVSGQIDRYDDGSIQDWKFTSVWEYIHGLKPEREAQLNILADLMRRNGEDIKGLQINMLFRDWSATKAEFDNAYPQTQIAVIDVPLWEPKKAREYIEQRLEVHYGPTVPDCTNEERWKDGDKYALMKEGRKSALRVTDSEGDLMEWAVWKKVVPTVTSELPKGHSIELRPSVAKRCKTYCNCSEFCVLYQNELKEQ
jgi:hypothetical protein